MSAYSLLAFAGNGFGALVGGWTEANPKLGWRWIQWIHLMFVDLQSFIGLFFLDVSFVQGYRNIFTGDDPRNERDPSVSYFGQARWQAPQRNWRPSISTFPLRIGETS